MKANLALLGVLLVCFVGGGAALADELDNPSFIDGSTGWEYTEGVLFNAGGPLVFDRPHIAFDPFPIPGAAGSIRQVVDNTRSPYWNPTLNDKIATVDFDVYTTGDAYVVVAFDWWDYMGPDKPVGAAQYEEVLPTHFLSPDEWNRFSVTYDWADKPGQTHQPRWISLEFGFFGCSGTGYEAAVDDVVLTSRCVPEPVSLAVLALGGLAMLRRRH